MLTGLIRFRRSSVSIVNVEHEITGWGVVVRTLTNMQNGELCNSSFSGLYSLSIVPSLAILHVFWGPGYSPEIDIFIASVKHDLNKRLARSGVMVSF